MPVPMSKEEVAFTIQLTRDRNNATHDAHYDRVLERMCNYIEANVDDFMECYAPEDEDSPIVTTDDGVHGGKKPIGNEIGDFKF